MASDNPTKTRGIEKQWLAEINKRFDAFRKSVIGELRNISRLRFNAAHFDIDPERLRAYMFFSQQQLDLLIVGNWQEKYQRRSYELAIERSMSELRRQGASIRITSKTRALAASINAMTIPQLASQNLLFPVHQEALGFLYTRSFEALSGFSQEMQRTVRNILFDGVREGRGINEIAGDINARIDIGRNRARLIARTETIQAYQRSTINQVGLFSETLGEEVLLRWLTTRGLNVRHIHAGWHGDVINAKNARKRIGVSPWNCQCGLNPVIKEANTKKKQNKFDKERKELQELQKL